VLIEGFERNRLDFSKYHNLRVLDYSRNTHSNGGEHVNVLPRLLTLLVPALCCNSLSVIRAVARLPHGRDSAVR
jgi:hypothetical protein